MEHRQSNLSLLPCLAAVGVAFLTVCPSSGPFPHGFLFDILTVVLSVLPCFLLDRLTINAIEKRTTNNQQVGNLLRWAFQLLLSLTAVVIIRTEKFPQLIYFYSWAIALLTGIAIGTQQKDTAGTPAAEINHKSSLLYVLALALVVVLGFAFRIYGIDFGLPDLFHPDEHKKSHIILQMIRRENLDPTYFRHPTLLLYLTRALVKIEYWINFTDLKGQPRVLLCGRLVSALAGTFAIPLTFLLGRLIFTPLVGLIAATLLSVSPLHITCSRYLKEDALFTTMALATVYLTTLALRKDDRKSVVWVGIFAGLTFGSKYTGLLILPLVLAIPFLRSWRRTGFPAFTNPDRMALMALPLAILGAAIAFLATTPYLLFDFRQFIQDFHAEMLHASSGHAGIAITATSNFWMYHAKGSLGPGIHWVVLLAAVSGLGLLATRNRPDCCLIMITAVLFYVTAEYAKSKPMPQPDRYVVQCIPYLTILAGVFLCHFFTQWRRLMAGALLITLPLMSTLTLARDLIPDTRIQTRQWMRENISRQSKILLSGGTVYLPQLKRAGFRTAEIKDVLHWPKASIVDELKNSGFDYLLFSTFKSDRFFCNEQNCAGEMLEEENLAREFPVVFQSIATSGSYAFHNPRLTLLRLR